METIKIEFANAEAAHHFAIWLSELGEQDYWDWMEYQERKEKGDITATRFRYHGAENDGEFMVDNTIRAECGRLDREATG